ncbi:acyl-CoA thioesterase [Nocardia miyunensis]|uniref:acyl-CoA thioesterase n=1 Tax=Nocardia miyunensis TaxID=282684 RepID=UPI0008307545|nr:acyl-CoA thioesterase domain-containing protein [Nocardia miyunensis]
MNLTRFRTMLDIGRDDSGRVVLPVLDRDAERVFGGQLLAQLITATQRDSGKTVKSLHVAFPRAARGIRPLFLDMEATHDGRSLGHRRAVVWQDDPGGRRVAVTASILLDHPDEGYDHQFDPAAVGDPAAATPTDIPVVPGEARIISETGLYDARTAPAEFAFWMRCADFTDEVLAKPVVAYVSDWPLIGTLLKPVTGVSQVDAHRRVETGVVTHSIWFHQPFDVSRWLRVQVCGQRLVGGRGFGTGAVYTEAGTLVASFAQESVIRESTV